MKLTKEGIFLFTTSIVFTLLYFGIDLYRIDNNLGYPSDMVNLYFPHFIQFYEHINAGNFQFGDFLTANHSTELVLRPNLSGFNPIYFLFSLIEVDTFDGYMLLFTFIHIFYTFIGVYFAQLLAKRFFKLHRLYALFFAVLFIFSSQSFMAAGFAPFFFIHMSLPMLLYFVLRVKRMTFYNALLTSGIFVFVYLQGYLPLSVFSIVMVVSVYFVYYYYLIPAKGSFGIKNFMIENKNLFSALTLSSIVVLPYYLAMLFYNAVASSVPIDIANIVDLDVYHLNFKDLMGVISYGIYLHSKTETYSLYLGLIPISIVVYYVFNTHHMSSFHKKAVFVFTVIFGLTFLISFGDFFALADLFYFLVPALGEMHIYSRFMLISHVLSSLAIAILFVYLIRHKISCSAYIKKCLVVIFFIFIAVNVQHFINIPSFKNLDLNFLNVELITFSIFLVALLKFEKRQIIWVAIILIFLNNLTFKNFVIKNMPIDNSIIYKVSEKNELIAFMRNNSKSKIIKYANLSSEIHPYVNRNFPWFVMDKVKLSNYYGYELHLASYLNYRKELPFYGRNNIELYLKSGVEFIISNKENIEKYKNILGNILDEKIVFHLSNGDSVYKLNPYSVSRRFEVGTYKIDFYSNINEPIDITVSNDKFKTIVGDNNKHFVEFKLKIPNNRLTIEFESPVKEGTQISNLMLYEHEGNPIEIKKRNFINNFDQEYSHDQQARWTRSFKGVGALEVFKTFKVSKSNKRYKDGFISFNKNDVEVLNFESDYSNYTKYKLKVKKDTVIEYLFHNSDSFNTEISSIGSMDDVTNTQSKSIALSKGVYMITYSYKNRLYTIFLGMIFFYLFILFIILGLSQRENILKMYNKFIISFTYFKQ